MYKKYASVGLTVVVIIGLGIYGYYVYNKKVNIFADEIKYEMVVSVEPNSTSTYPVIVNYKDQSIEGKINQQILEYVTKNRHCNFSSESDEIDSLLYRIKGITGKELSRDYVAAHRLELYRKLKDTHDESEVEVTYAKNDIFSVNLSNYCYEDPMAHGNSIDKTLLFDLTTGSNVSDSDIFLDPKRDVDKINLLVKNKYIKMLTEKPDLIDNSGINSNECVQIVKDDADHFEYSGYTLNAASSTIDFKTSVQSNCEISVPLTVIELAPYLNIQGIIGRFK